MERSGWFPLVSREVASDDPESATLLGLRHGSVLIPDDQIDREVESWLACIENLQSIPDDQLLPQQLALIDAATIISKLLVQGNDLRRQLAAANSHRL